MKGDPPVSRDEILALIQKQSEDQITQLTNEISDLQKRLQAIENDDSFIELQRAAAKRIERLRVPRSRALAEMYSYWTLDPIVEAAKLIANEIAQQPRHYRNVAPDVAQTLASFRIRLGSDPDWPNADQRTVLFYALYGVAVWAPNSNERPQFNQLVVQLISAATAFAERVHDTGEDMLRQSCRDAAFALRAYLETLPGEPLSLSYAQTTQIFDAAVNILRDPGVAARFGLQAAPRDLWPRDPALSGDGAFLLEEIIKKLAPSYSAMLSQQRVVSLLRIAYYGNEAISIIAERDLQIDATINELITSSYRWGTAKQGLHN